MKVVDERDEEDIESFEGLEPDVDYTTIRGPLLNAYYKLRALSEDRAYILTRMEELKESFYDDLEINPYITDLPVVTMFTQFLDLYNEYKIKWEDSIKVYNKSFKDVIESVDENYISISESEKQNRQELRKRDLEVVELKKELKRQKIAYEKRISSGLLTKENLIEELTLTAKRIADVDGNIKLNKLIRELATLTRGDKKLAKIRDKDIDVKDDETKVKEYFKIFKTSENPGHKKSALAGGLKRKLATKKIKETQYMLEMSFLNKAFKLYKDSVKFKVKKTKKSEPDEQE